MYKVDHHYPGSSNNPVAAILYGDISKWDSNVHTFHEELKRLAMKGDVNYILRHYVKASITVNVDIFALHLFSCFSHSNLAARK